MNQNIQQTVSQSSPATNSEISYTALGSTHVRLTPAQKALARSIAEIEGCSMAALVRDFLEERAQALGLSALGDGEVWRVVGGGAGVPAAPTLTPPTVEPPPPELTEKARHLIDCKQFEPALPVVELLEPVELAALVRVANDVDRRTLVVASVKQALSALQRLIPYAALLWIKAKAVEAYRAFPESAQVFVEQHLNTVHALSAGQRLRYLDVLLW
jgi:hypothetical protein